MAVTPSQEFKVELISAVKTARVYALSLTRNKDSADDLVQSALLKALENFEKFQLGTNLGAWLNTIVKNTFFDDKKSYRVSRTDQMEEESKYDKGDSGSSQLNDMQIAQINDYLNENLEDRDRSVFLMWVEGLKTEEIASALNLTRSNVGVIVCRVRKEIHERFAGE
jgi:RNA polymerase sigma-70 factor, ECF subfamily